MKTKARVILVGLHTKMWLAILVADAIWKGFGDELVITEAVCYRKSGFHPLGRACDFRVNRFSKAKQTLLRQKLADALGDDYDVILHGEGANIHIHCEFDPTNPKII